MKTPTLILMALLAAMTSPAIKAAEIQTSIPLPEWKTPAQLAAWSEALHQKALAKEAAQAASSRPSTLDSSTSYFYTGKPYLAESGSYAFKYREYNPEMNRWTTVDPSGFPDGANNRVYAAVPTSQFDPNGNNTQNISANFTLPSATQNDGYIFNVNGTIQASLGQAPSSVGGVAIGGAKQNSFTMYVGVIAQTDISVFYTAESPSIILDTMTLVDGPVVNNVQTKFYSGKAVFTATDAVEFKGTAGVSFSYFGVDFKMGAGGSSTYNYTLSQTNKVSIEVE